MRVQSLGRAPVVGKTSILVSFQNFSVILDCGGSVDDIIELKWRIKSPVYMIISHTHDDHAYSLFSLVQENSFSSIYMSRYAKTVLVFRGSDPYSRYLFYTVHGVDYHQKIHLQDGIYFMLTPAGHSPGSAAIQLFREGYSLLAFTGDMELLRHFWYVTSPIEQTPFLIVDSSFSFLYRAPMALKSANYAQMQLLNIPVIHPQNAEGMGQETTARLQLFMRQLGCNPVLHVDYAHCLTVNNIARICGHGRFFGDILGRTEVLSAFSPGPMITVPTQLGSGSTAAFLAIKCSECSVLMHYDLCLAGDSFRLFYHLVDGYRLGDKVVAGNIKHLKMWGDYHLDYRDLCSLIDHAMPAYVFLQHALQMGELHIARQKLEQALPFVSFKELKDSSTDRSYYLATPVLDTTYKTQLHRVEVACSVAALYMHFEELGILLDPEENCMSCGQIVIYGTKDYNHSIICFTEDTGISDFVQELKAKYGRTQYPESYQ